MKYRVMCLQRKQINKRWAEFVIAILVVCLRIKNDDTTSKQTVKISPVRKEVY